MKSMQEALAAMRQEHDALLECLRDAGVLKKDTITAKLHRRHFEAVQREHPCDWSASLLSMVGKVSAVNVLGAYAGEASCNALAASSKAISDALVATHDLMSGSGSNLYICGGRAGRADLASVERFNLQKGTWEVLPPMTQARSGAAALVTEGRLYVCGGRAHRTEDKSAVERFDPAVGAWKELPPESRAWDIFADAAVAEPILRCGGCDRGDLQQKGHLGMCLPTEVAVILPMLAQRRAQSASACIAGQIYLCGGLSEEGSVTAKVECFDIATGAPTDIPAMPEALAGAAAAVFGEDLYVCGGYSEATDFGPSRSVYLLNVKKQKGWEVMPPMHHARSGATTCVLSGLLHICGGYGDTDAHNSVERFDPSVGVWTELMPMLHRRAEATIATSGQSLYIFGGLSGEGEALSSVERLDFKSGVWESMPPMTEGRAQALGIVV